MSYHDDIIVQDHDIIIHIIVHFIVNMIGSIMDYDITGFVFDIIHHIMVHIIYDIIDMIWTMIS
jgi:hypothetical protein